MKKILLIISMLWGFAYAQCADEDTVRNNAVTFITYSSARVNGTTGHFVATPTSISLRYWRNGMTDTITAVHSGANALFNITSLYPATLYNYYYVTTCGVSTNPQLAISSFTTLANTVVYTPMDAKGYQARYFKADSGLIVPRGDTAIVNAPNIGGQIKFKASDSTFYGYNGVRWAPMNLDSAGFARLFGGKVDSVTVNGDSLFYWVTGTAYGYVLGNRTTKTLATVDDIATYDYVDAVVNSVTLIVKDSLRGGVFNLYNGSDTADGGMIFEDFNANKWLRQTDGSAINVNWYGLVARTNYVDDDAPLINRAIEFINKHPSQYNQLYFPAGNNRVTIGNSWYLLGSTVTLQNINIFGDGQPQNPLTKFQVLPDVKAFDIPALDNNGNSNHVRVSNILVSHYAPLTAARNSHSFNIQCFVDFYNVAIYYNEGGNGFNILACGGAVDSTYGNTDQSTFVNCSATYCENGAYISGCDANVMKFDNCSWVSNRYWGVYDNGFLGNLYINNHWANNGKQGDCLVTYGGLYYVSEDSTNNIGKRPDLEPTFWHEVGAMGGANPWDTTVHYYSGGTAAIVNVNAFSKFIMPYTESFQPPMLLNLRSSAEGGDNDAGVRGGVVRGVVNGIDISTSTNKNGSQVDKLGVNQAPTDHLISATGTNYQLMRLTSPSSLTELRMSNSVDDYGGVSYLDSSLLFLAHQGYVLQLEGRVLKPYSLDAQIDFGTGALRWKNGYFANLFGGGSNLTLSTSATTDTSTYKPLVVDASGNQKRSTYWYGAGGGSIDTTGQFVTDIVRTPGVDSFWYRKGGVLYGIKDSTGGGGSGWDLTGNTVGADGKWVGTIDAYDFQIKTNNTSGFKMSTGQNVQFGGSNNNSFGSTGGVTIGNNNTTYFQSLTVGSGNSSLNNYQSVFGSNNAVYGQRGFSQGKNHTIVGDESAGFGESNFTRAAHEFSIGYFGTDYTAAGNLTDRLFNIGSSQDGGTTPKNAMTILRDGRIGLGIRTSTPDASAVVDIESTTQGFLPPRMTATQASAISSPAEGLIVYVTNTNGTFTAKGWWGWDGAAWYQFWLPLMFIFKRRKKRQ